MAQTVLVADDSVASQRLFEMVLTREGFDVVTVGSGPDVLNTVKEKQPDLALIDAVMPDVDGYQICQSLKKDPQFNDLPVIMLAGAYEGVDLKRGESIVGAHAILEKPATSQIILAKVKELLTAQQEAQQTVAASADVAQVVQEPSFVEEEYEFDEDSEEVDLAVENELLEEEAEWEELDEDIEELPDEVEDIGVVEEFDEIEAIEDVAEADEDIEEVEEDFEEVEEGIDEIEADAVIEDVAPVSQETVTPQNLASAPSDTTPQVAAISSEQLDAVAEEIAQRVAAKLGPVLLQSLAEYVLQFPAVRQVVDNASQKLVREILPDIQDSFK